MSLEQMTGEWAVKRIEELESECAALRAEVERLRALMRDGDDADAGMRDIHGRARALMKKVFEEQSPTVSTLCAIGDFLSNQAPATTEREAAESDDAGSDPYELCGVATAHATVNERPVSRADIRENIELKIAAAKASRAVKP